MNRHKFHESLPVAEITGKDILWFFVKVLLTATVMAIVLIGWLSL